MSFWKLSSTWQQMQGKTYNHYIKHVHIWYKTCQNIVPKISNDTCQRFYVQSPQKFKTRKKSCHCSKTVYNFIDTHIHDVPERTSSEIFYKRHLRSLWHGFLWSCPFLGGRHINKRCLGLVHMATCPGYDGLTVRARFNSHWVPSCVVLMTLLQSGWFGLASLQATQG